MGEIKRMIEYRYKFPNRKKRKQNKKGKWIESDYSDGANSDVNFSLVDVRINDKIYTKRSDAFIFYWEREFIWLRLND